MQTVNQKELALDGSARIDYNAAVRQIPMSNTHSKSFQLDRPACPQCHCAAARLNLTPGNFWRILLAFASGLVLYPVVSIRFKCARCGNRFLA